MVRQRQCLDYQSERATPIRRAVMSLFPAATRMVAEAGDQPHKIIKRSAGFTDCVSFKNFTATLTNAKRSFIGSAAIVIGMSQQQLRAM